MNVTDFGHYCADAAARLARANRIAHWLGHYNETVRLLERGIWPLFDLALRLWLAQVVWLAGLMRMMGPVETTEATLRTVLEMACPLLLALGLGTRVAALGLLALALYYGQPALGNALPFTLLCIGYAVLGAGPLALDRSLARGFADSALPFAGGLCRLLGALTRTVGPLYQMVLRGGLAWLLVTLANHALLVALCAPLLVLGLATRPAALLALVGCVGLWLDPTLPAALHTDLSYLMLLFGHVFLRGAGSLALDAELDHWLRARFPQLDGQSAVDLEHLPQVVIVGAGFGGLAAARALRHAPCRVTLIDRHNYHLFQPLLYQVATAALSPADIATPIRELVRDQYNARVLLGEVTDVDTVRREVVLKDRQLRYDYLIIATGARHAYFGRDQWETLAPGLKRIDDATHIRRRLLLAFEQAENATDPAEQQQWMTFAIVGAGPTGVELAGAIAELAHHGLLREFRHCDPRQARVLLIQSGPRVLPTFPESLSAATARSLTQLGVDVLTDSKVEQVDETGIVVNGQHIAARTVLWAAGVVASPAARWLKADSDSAGRLKVNPDLSVPELAQVFAIGDTALAHAWDGKPVPGLAPAAKQGGDYVAAVICARLEGRAAPAPFRYVHRGSLATIGRRAAVADFGRLRLCGAVAWWFWGAVHVLFLANLRSRIMVAVQWFWAYLTFRRSTRLITGDR